MIEDQKKLIKIKSAWPSHSVRTNDTNTRTVLSSNETPLEKSIYLKAIDTFIATLK